ncbi:hypothetical protein [Streptomyces sp. CA-251251]|uniref:hypothetical protein n=1 Tax=Streptomyces sp. CA-251251 TaxID=3240063 RepID=UPI003D9182B8
MSSHTPAGADLVHLGATEALRIFARGELSPVALMRAAIERAEKVEPGINALTERLFDEALEQARHAEDRYLGRNGPPDRRPPLRPTPPSSASARPWKPSGPGRTHRSKTACRDHSGDPPAHCTAPALTGNAVSAQHSGLTLTGPPSKGSFL